MNTKDWWKSITMWGVMISIIASLLQMLGVAQITLEEQQNLAQLIVNVATGLSEIIGFLMIIIGRMRANKPISNNIIPKIGGTA